MKIQISKESEKIIKSLKQRFRSAFIDEAIIYFAKTQEGIEKLERWKTDINNGSKVSLKSTQKEFNGGKEKELSPEDFKELAGDFAED
jgi:hypothetical protein